MSTPFHIKDEQGLKDLLSDIKKAAKSSRRNAGLYTVFRTLPDGSTPVHISINLGRWSVPARTKRSTL
jgi:hypothetical protein